MKKKNHVRTRFSTLLLCCLAIVLCAAPCGWAIYYGVGEHYVEEDIDWMHVETGATVHLKASVSQYVVVYPGSVLNIYSGSVADYVVVSDDEPYAVVTVYGTGFKVDGELLDTSATQFTVDLFSGGVLTGSYENGDDINLKFLSSEPIHLVNLDPEVEIDIKPGSDLNSINLKSKGVVPVAVFTTKDLDARTIDPYTVLFAGASTERWKLCDVDGDGNDDMMLFHFKTQYLVELDENSTRATLTGTTFDGDDIKLTDTVRIVQSKKE